MKIRVTNIDWDIDKEEVHELLDQLSVEDAANALGVPAQKYAYLSEEKRHDLVDDIFRHVPGKLYDFLRLPCEGEIDESDVDDVAEHLSNLHGYCIKSLHIENEPITVGA